MTKAKRISTMHQAPQTVRLQVDITEARNEKLGELLMLCGFASKKDVFNNAIMLFDWAVEEVAKGNVIASVNRDRREYEVVRMPGLDHAAAKAKASTRAPVDAGGPLRPVQIDERKIGDAPAAR